MKENTINGDMVNKRKLVDDSKVTYFNQITWTKNNDGSVTQRWDILSEGANK